LRPTSPASAVALGTGFCRPPQARPLPSLQPWLAPDPAPPLYAVLAAAAPREQPHPAWSRTLRVAQFDAASSTVIARPARRAEAIQGRRTVSRPWIASRRLRSPRNDGLGI